MAYGVHNLTRTARIGNTARNSGQSAELSNSLVDDRVDGASQIEAANFGTHRESQIAAGLLAKNRGWQSARFASEQKDVPRREGGIPHKARGGFRERPPGTPGQAFSHLGPAFDGLPIDKLPIIHAGSAEVPFVETKAQRADQPQLGADGHAGASDVAGVLRNVRLIKNNVEQRFWRHGSIRESRDCNMVGMNRPASAVA